MTDAPIELAQEQLDELGIRVEVEEPSSAG
jgi:hypothetical protein